eukprot:CAMPEP_0170069502 /NCGR_PEP_ID=MMETSP0019_2-20121128/8154_1 /TAXON_ID=98059 /ORGANISM="Dinobryon sp., Strain UTEXLB2267" /LENGTH=932 /DNA_ID=CAMNT_0010277565 /DNA_START=106 /DNA_END=2904 /DNA_ORIENTATION=-
MDERMSFRPPKKPSLTLDSSLVQDDLPQEVIPKVFIGSIHSAYNLDALQCNGITHILNASRLPITFPKQFTYLSVEIRDKGDSNILSCIPTSNIFIEAGVENGGTLIHCFGGKSRSAAFISAYLMSSFNWSFDKAYSVVKIARPIVEINSGFECQLRAYAVASFDVYVAQQVLLRRRIRDLHQLRDPKASDTNNNNNNSTVLSSLDTSDLPAHLKSHHPGPQHADSISAMPIMVNSASISDLSKLEINGSNGVVTNAHTAANNNNSEPSPESIRRMSALHKRSWRDAKHESGGESFGDIDAKLSLAEQNSIANSNVNMIEMDTSSSLRSHSPNVSVYDTVAELPVIMLGRRSSVTIEAPDHSAMRKMILTSSSNSMDSTHSEGSITHTYPSHASMARSSSFSVSSGNLRRNGSSRSIRSTRRRDSMFAGTTLSNAELETKTPSCRLSRPGSSWVRVMPPLRGLEREFKCSWCNTSLFSLANVVRVDIDTLPLLDEFRAEEKAAAVNAEDKQQHQQHKESSMDVPSSSMRGPTPRIKGSFFGAVNGGIHSGTSSSSSMDGHMVMSPPPYLSSGPVNFDSLISPRTSNDMDVEIPIDNDDDVDYAPAEPKYVPALKSTRASSINASAKGFSFDIPQINLNSTRASMSSSHNVDNSMNLGDKPVAEVANIRKSSQQSKSFPLDDLPSGPFRSNTASRTGMVRGSGLSLSFCSDSKSSTNNLQFYNGSGGGTPSKSSKPHSPIAFGSNGSSTGFQHNQVSSRPSSATTTLYAGLQQHVSSSSGSSCADDSPRVMIPPHRVGEVGWSPNDRPQSAEKRRWLARVNLLREREGGDSKVAKMAEDDDNASMLAFGRDKYLCIEYLPWMGREVFQSNKDTGDICCSDCHKIVGSWQWKPSFKLLQNGKFEAPLFLIHKHVVHQSDLLFDSTPNNTPRHDI